MTEDMTYFTRLKGLASVVWNPEKKNALARFNKQGLLATTDPQVVDTLTAMGYRRVTAEDITNAGLMLPTEDEAPNATGAPGRGYTPPAPGESGPVMGAAMAGKPGRIGADANQLFEPDPGAPPPGDAGRRRLIK